MQRAHRGARRCDDRPRRRPARGDRRAAPRDRLRALVRAPRRSRHAADEPRDRHSDWARELPRLNVEDAGTADVNSLAMLARSRDRRRLGGRRGRPRRRRRQRDRGHLPVGRARRGPRAALARARPQRARARARRAARRGPRHARDRGPPVHLAPHRAGPPEVGLREGRRAQPPRARLARLRPGRLAALNPDLEARDALLTRLEHRQAPRRAVGGAAEDRAVRGFEAEHRDPRCGMDPLVKARQARRLPAQLEPQAGGR